MTAEVPEVAMLRTVRRLATYTVMIAGLFVFAWGVGWLLVNAFLLIFGVRD